MFCVQKIVSWRLDADRQYRTVSFERLTVNVNWPTAERARSANAVVGFNLREGKRKSISKRVQCVRTAVRATTILLSPLNQYRQIHNTQTRHSYNIIKYNAHSRAFIHAHTHTHIHAHTRPRANDTNIVIGNE